MSTDWTSELEPDVEAGPVVDVVLAPGFPPPRHPAEPDCFARHAGVPGHCQRALETARIAIVGAGGLGGWVALALARSGAREIQLIDPERFDRTNAARQLMFGSDVGEPKAFAVARNLAPHVVAGGRVTGIRLPFRDASERFVIAADVAVCAVDNNECRLAVTRFARRAGIPAVFGMLSTDAMRLHAFFQEAAQGSACLWCALPNLDPDSIAPCASATIVSCLLAAAHLAFLVHRALMPWPGGAARYNWREADLLGGAPDRVALVARRHDCRVCG